MRLFVNPSCLGVFVFATVRLCGAWRLLLPTSDEEAEEGQQNDHGDAAGDDGGDASNGVRRFTLETVCVLTR